MCPYDTCSYKGLYKAIAAMLTGDAFTGGAYGPFRSNTRILQTGLIRCPEMATAASISNDIARGCPEQSLERAVKTLSDNATLGFFGALPSV